ncbi:MAG: hypothetical protein Q8Q73_14310 [Stagnimonas sp.]|nr:hypothetical protein [Stagnimonas sp.]
MTQRCPHCQIARISLVKKLVFGPIFKFRCVRCGNRWRVSSWSVVVSLLAIASMPILIGLAWLSGSVRPGAGSAVAIVTTTLILAALAITYVVPVRKVG